MSRHRRRKNARDLQLSFGPLPDGVEDNNQGLAIGSNPVPKSEPSTVPSSDSSTRPKQPGAKQRRKSPIPIQTPLDCLNASDRAEYVALLSASTSPSGKLGSQPSGLVQIGYSQLCTTTSLCKRTVQRATSRLIKKGFMEIYTPANYPAGESTVYRVLDLAEIGATMQGAGLTHWVQTGSGRHAIRISDDDLD